LLTEAPGGGPKPAKEAIGKGFEGQVADLKVGHEDNHLVQGLRHRRPLWKRRGRAGFHSGRKKGTEHPSGRGREDEKDSERRRSGKGKRSTIPGKITMGKCSSMPTDETVEQALPREEGDCLTSRYED